MSCLARLRRQNLPKEAQANWSIDETKSPTDGSPQVVAANLVNDTALILRCKDQTAEAALSTRYNYLGSRIVDVQLRINDQKCTQAGLEGVRMAAPLLLQTPWLSFSPLPDNGKLSIRTTRSNDGKIKEASFNLGAVSEVRNKIAKACDWGSGSVDEPVGSIERQERR
jgi:hypothetical protein